MERLTAFILNRKKAIIAVFAVVLLVSCLLLPLISVNADLTKYLPNSAQSREGDAILRREFGNDMPNARVMVPNVSVPQAVEIKAQLAAIDGVDAVLWLDDAASLSVPLAMLPDGVADLYYKDNNALFTLSVNPNADAAAVVTAIRAVIGDDGAMSGTVIDNGTAAQTNLTQTALLLLISLPLLLLVLVLCTDSYAEPLLCLLTALVAALIQLGTNALLTSVSSISHAAMTLVVMALTAGFGLVVLRRYATARNGDPSETALAVALRQSLFPIGGGALAVLVSCIALILMKFKLGADVGFVLAKGVVVSVASALLLLPVLLQLFARQVEASSHKPFLPRFQSMGRVAIKLRVVTFVLVILLLLPAVLAYGKGDMLFGTDKLYSTASRAGRDAARIDERFGGDNTLILLVPRGNTAAEAALSGELRTLDFVTDIVSYVDTYGASTPPETVDEATRKAFLSDKYSRFLLRTSLTADTAASFDAISAIQVATDAYYDDYYLCGTPFTAFDIHSIVTADLTLVLCVTAGALLVLLLLLFSSVLAPIALLGTAALAVLFNMSISYFTGGTMHYLAFLLASVLGLCVAVGYGILYTKHYVNARYDFDRDSAVTEAARDSAIPMLGAGGLMVLLGLALAFCASQTPVRQVGLLMARGTVISLLLSLLFLPPLLKVLDTALVKSMWRKLPEGDAEDSSELEQDEPEQEEYDEEEYSEPDDYEPEPEPEFTPDQVNIDENLDYDGTILPDQSIFDELINPYKTNGNSEEEKR